MKEFPMVRSWRAAITGVIAVAVPLLALSLTPLTGIYAAMLTILFLPAALCITGLTGGLAPMLLGAASGIYAMHILAGQQGALLAAVYVLPIVAAFLLLIGYRVPFWKSCGWMIGVHVLALTGVYLLLQQMTGQSLYTAAGDAVMNALKEWELGDTMLYQFYSAGMLTLPEELSENALLQIGDAYMLSPAARADLLLSMRSFVQSGLATLLPSLIVTQSILGGVLCLLLSVRFGYLAAERRAFRSGDESAYAPGDAGKKPQLDFPTLGMPPLSLWHLPRGTGWKVGAALAAGYLLQGGSSAPMVIAGIILYSAATAIFTLQGAALINFMQKTRGIKRVWRIIVPILLMLLSVLSLIGIFDQIVNIRGLRKPREPKEDE